MLDPVIASSDATRAARRLMADAGRKPKSGLQVSLAAFPSTRNYRGGHAFRRASDGMSSSLETHRCHATPPAEGLTHKRRGVHPPSAYLPKSPKSCATLVYEFVVIAAVDADICSVPKSGGNAESYQVAA